MRRTHQGPRWWSIWFPLFGLGGLLMLEHQASLSPGGHQVAEIALALLMYSVVVCWLRYNRGALVHQEYECEQKREGRCAPCAHTVAPKRAAQARQPRQEPVIHDDEPWDEAWLPWHSNGPDTDIYRRR